jgi:hypothetical protein
MEWVEPSQHIVIKINYIKNRLDIGPIMMFLVAKRAIF